MIGYLKLAGLITGAVAVSALVFIVNGWRTDAERVPLLENALQEERTKLAQQIIATRKVQKASEGFQNELESLRATRAAAPVRSVRVCSLPAASATAQPGSDEVIPGTGGAPPTVGPDIGPDLYAIADSADELSAQVRGLQEYARPCSTH